MTDNLTNITSQILDLLERDGSDYLIQVYSPSDGGYEWLPVTEEMVELLILLTEALE